MKKKPNILILMSDEHRADVLGCDGNDIVRTPTLDALAERGTYFRNCYCTSPVCVPSRQSFHAGKLPSTINCKKFGDSFASDILTFPEHLARHGYKTVAYGKMHFEDQDQMHGWRSRPMGDVNQRINPPFEGDSPAHLKDPKLYREEGMGFWGPAKEVRNARSVIMDASKLGMEKDMVDGACKWLRNWFAGTGYDRPGNAPLCFCLSLSNPHYPFQCEEELMDYYITRVKPFIETAPNDHPCHRLYAVNAGEEASPREILRATAAYYAQVEFIDTMYAKVLTTLEKLNALDDFIVLYWTDHGDMLGQHGLWEKKQFYDASSRVPLIISDPRQPEANGQVTQVTSLLDIFPTLCDLVEIPTPTDLEGDSLLPLMHGKSDGWRDEAISELWGWYHECQGKGCWMIRRGQYKFNTYNNSAYPDQLFDMEADPHEVINLAELPDYAEVMAAFKERSDELAKRGS